MGLNLVSGRFPWQRKWQPTPVILPGKSHGQSSQAGYSPQGSKRVRRNWATKQQQKSIHRHTACCAALSHFSLTQLCAALWTVAHQAPLSMEFSRQEYWSGLPCSPPGGLPNPGIGSKSPVYPALQADSLPLSHQDSSVAQLIGDWAHFDSKCLIFKKA